MIITFYKVYSLFLLRTFQQINLFLFFTIIIHEVSISPHETSRIASRTPSISYLLCYYNDHTSTRNIFILIIYRIIDLYINSSPSLNSSSSNVLLCGSLITFKPANVLTSFIDLIIVLLKIILNI